MEWGNREHVFVYFRFLNVYFKSFSSPTKKLPFVFNKLNMFRIDNDVLTCWPAVSDVIGTPGERRPEYPTDIPIRRGISTRHNFHLHVYVNLDISHFFPRWYRNIKDPCNRYHQWIIVVLSLICWWVDQFFWFFFLKLLSGAPS